MKKLIGLALLLCSCAGNPSLPERQIDHPYTLPTDTREFALGVGVARVRELDGRTVNIFGAPGGWAIPISENWTWDLLTMVRHQFHHGARDTAGVRFGVSAIGYSTLDGLIMSPSAEFYYKRLLSPNFALENTLGGDWLTRTRLPGANGWRTYLNVAPLFQLDDNKALSVSAGLALVHRYFGWNMNSLSLFPSDQTRVVVPLGTRFAWRFSKRWEGDVNYRLDAIGQAQGYRAQTLAAVMHYYW